MEIQILCPNSFIIILSKESVNTEKNASFYLSGSKLDSSDKTMHLFYIYIKIYAAPRLPFLHAASNSFNFLLASLLRFFGTSI